jgi:hypothetical protein
MRGIQIGICAAILIQGCDKGTPSGTAVGRPKVDLDAAAALVAKMQAELDRALAENAARVPDVSASDFTILNYRMSRQYDEVVVNGEVKNTGLIAAGVELEAVTRDEKGDVVDSKRFWPNSTSNIPAGKTCAIHYYVSRGPYAKSLDVRVVQAKIW